MSRSIVRSAPFSAPVEGDDRGKFEAEFISAAEEYALKEVDILKTLEGDLPDHTVYKEIVMITNDCLYLFLRNTVVGTAEQKKTSYPAIYAKHEELEDKIIRF
jgi:hypothetical protein